DMDVFSMLPQNRKSAMAEPHWIADGPNRVSVRIAGDTVHVAPHGQVTYQLLVEYLRIVDVEAVSRHGTLYFVASVQHNKGTLDVTGRRYLAEWLAHRRVGGLAVIGASWIVRNLTVLIFNAASLLKRTRIPIAFFAREEQAAAWIESLRNS